MGIIFSLIDQSWPPKSKFNVQDIPDLTGRVAIVTGGNVGIGRETVKALLLKNAKVYMASRSKEKADAAITSLKEEIHQEAIFLELDLASLDAVRKSAAEFKSKESELHMLFNSGGVMVPPIEATTKDGYDLQFGTNVLGHYLFTMELLPTLLAGAKSSPDKKARVVNTSSSAQEGATDIKWDTLSDGPARKKVGKWGLYSQSKFGNVIFSHELAKRYGDEGIVSTSLNPGNIKTDLQRHLTGIEDIIIQRTLYATPFGALTQLWAGTSPETAEMNGKYLIPWARVGKIRPCMTDRAIGEKLWTWLEEQTKGR